MVEPGDGNPSRETHPTEVKIIYDDEVIYIAAYLFDNEPEKILRQFTQRDNIGQSDLFILDLNTYNDGENQTRFVITSAGTQADAKMAGGNEDYSYNVVWEPKESGKTIRRISSAKSFIKSGLLEITTKSRN